MSRAVLVRVGTAVLVVLAAAVTVRYIAVTWVDRMDVNAVLPYANLLMSDFRDAVWLPTGDVLAGHDPYDDAAFVTRHPGTQGYSPYTPAHLVLTLGLGTLSWSTGTLVWAVLGGIALAAMGAWAGVATLRFARPTAGRLECVAAAAAGVLLVWVWRPSSTAIGLGQPTSVYGPAAAVAAAATVIAVGLPHWARTVLSLLAICKPQTGIQLAIAAAAARQWRALVGGFVIACVLSLAIATVIAGGPGSVVGWVLELPAAVSGHHSRFDQRYTTGNPWIDVMSTSYRLGLPDVVGPLLAVLLLVVGIVAAMALRRRGLPALGALTAMTVGLLVVPHCGYDVLLLLPVLMLAVVETVRMPARGLAVAALVPLTLSGLLPNFRLPLVPGGLEPALGQAVLLLVGFAVLVVLARSVPDRAPADHATVGSV